MAIELIDHWEEALINNDLQEIWDKHAPLLDYTDAEEFLMEVRDTFPEWDEKTLFQNVKKFLVPVDAA